MLLTWVVDLLGGPERNCRVDELVVVRHKMNPFLIPGHSDRAITKLFQHVISMISLALQDSSVGVVCFLDFAHNNGFELTTRALEVQVGLAGVSPGVARCALSTELT